MSQPITPLAVPVPPADLGAAHRERDLDRLLGQARRLMARLVSAEAHHLPDEVALARALGDVETQLEMRHPALWPDLQAELAEAPLRWAHDGTATPVASCLVCRRIACGLPLGLPVPARPGVAR